MKRAALLLLSGLGTLAGGYATWWFGIKILPPKMLNVTWDYLSFGHWWSGNWWTAFWFFCFVWGIHLVLPGIMFWATWLNASGFWRVWSTKEK